MIIRHTPKPAGPGNNLFLKENVEVQGNEIILKTKCNFFWSCAEVSWPAKEGIYEMDLEVPFLPKGITCGIFLYQDDTREIDIEFGRWNKILNQNCQFVKQQTTPIRFWNFSKNNKIKIEYKKDFVKLNLNGRTKIYDHNFKFTSFIVNLWIYGEPTESQIKIKNFKYSH